MTWEQPGGSGIGSDRWGTDVGLVRPVPVGVGLGVVISMFWFSSELQRAEAAAAVPLCRLLGLQDVQRAGTSVLFDVAGRLTGFDITVGCSAAFLLLPFVVITSVLLSVRRIRAGRAVGALVAAVLVILAVNQARLLSIAAGMNFWGIETGYARTHILVGTIVSTLGVVLAGSCYLAVLLRGTFPDVSGWGARETLDDRVVRR